MNKKIFMSGVLMAILLLLVNTAFALQTVNTDPSAANPGASANGSFVLTNDDAANPATGISISSAALVGVTDATKNIPSSAISFSPSSVSSLAANGSTTITTTVAIPSNLAAQTYQGTVTVSGTVSGATVTSTFTLSVVVNSYSSLDVPTYDTTTSLEIRGQEDNSGTGTFTVTNNGNVILNSFTFTNNINLNDSDGDSISLTFSNPGTVNPGASATVTITAAFGNNIDLDNYAGTVNVTSGTATDSFRLNLQIQPEICSDGIVKDGDTTSSGNAFLDIDLREPDNGDDIKPGDTLNIDVRVQNDDDTDMDVVVEAFLWNLDQNEEIASVEGDSVNINDGDTETYELELEIPKSSDLDTDDSYVLYVKAYEDGDEDQNCNEESVNLDFEREAHATVVKQVTISPSTASCSETIDIKVDVENQGTRDEDDVYIQVKNNELNLDMESNLFDLDDFAGNDESATKRFSFTVPNNAQAKDYLIEGIVYYNDGDDTQSEFETLSVRECGTVTNGGSTNGGSVSQLSLSTGTTSIVAGKSSAQLHLVVSSIEDRDLQGTLSFTPVGDWADSLLNQPVSLHSGENNLYFTAKLGEVQAGMNSATVTIRPARSGDFAERQFTLNFDVVAENGVVSESGLFGGLFDGRSTTFWIIGDVILVVVALFIVKAVFFRKPF
ncbi:putative S-layer protein [Candidatus Woesearchaeota archaeon]|nr:putative S-layer protein [Candidatus Woesearchaeota archaeon]